MQGEDGHQSLNQEAGSPQTLNLPAPWSWTFSLQSPEKSTCLVHKPPSLVVFCSSSPNGLRHVTSFDPIHFIRRFGGHDFFDVFQARRGLGHTNTHKWDFWSLGCIKKSRTPLNWDSQQTLTALCARLCFCVFLVMQCSSRLSNPSAPFRVTKFMYPRVTCANQHSHCFPHKESSFCYHKYLWERLMPFGILIVTSFVTKLCSFDCELFEKRIISQTSFWDSVS